MWGDTAAWRTVVGVAGDIRFRSLRDATPTMYLPWRQLDFTAYLLAVRTNSGLGALLPAMRRVLRDIDPEASIARVMSMDDLLAGQRALPRLSTLLLAGFGLTALLLAAIGLFGIMASSVRERTREIGVRAALGATPERLRREVLGQAMVVSGLGALAGLAGAFATSRLLASLLFEVSPTDPIAQLGACGLLVAVAMLAALVPAQRATRVDPAQTMRAE